MSGKREGGMPWFRFYGGDVLGDPKLATLTDGQYRVWVNLLCLASSQSERGMIVGMGDKLLAALVARGDRQLMRETLAELQDLNIVAIDGEDNERLIAFIHFDARQYDKPSDQPERVSARVAAFRARQAALRNAPVTPCNAPEEETDPETDPETDRSPEIPDGISAPAVLAGAVASPAPSPPPSRSEGDAGVSTPDGPAAGSEPAPEAKPAAPKLKPIYGDDSVPMQLARTLGAGIHRNKPDAKLPRDGLQSWAREFDLMMRVDHRPREKIEAVIAYAMRSPFWRSVVFSAAQIRRKFDVIDAQRVEDANGTRKQAANGNGSARRQYNGSNGGAGGSGGGTYPRRLPTQDEYRELARKLGQIPGDTSGGGGDADDGAADEASGGGSAGTFHRSAAAGG